MRKNWCMYAGGMYICHIAQSIKVTRAFERAEFVMLINFSFWSISKQTVEYFVLFFIFCPYYNSRSPQTASQAIQSTALDLM